jgi:competence protein ComEC
VRFEVVHPPAADYDKPPRKSNDMSCVLKVEAPGGTLLLAADVEGASEVRLAAQPLRADYLVAPHHGSRSSSSADFVAAVQARTVIFPVGYRSRFRHPHPEVVARYVATGARLLRTDRDGAVTLLIAPDASAVVRERERSRRYWHSG